MEAAVFIAKIFGVFYLVAAAGMAFNREFYRRFMEDYCKSTALIFFSGVLALIIGMLIVLVHNVWVANWTVIITILGWLALLKGIWIIVFPDTVSRFMQVYQRNKNLLVAYSIAAFILGLILTFLGFSV